MTAAITRAEALYALATAPFVVVCLLAIGCSIAYVIGRENAERTYLSPETQKARERLHAEADSWRTRRGERR